MDIFNDKELNQIATKISKKLNSTVNVENQQEIAADGIEIGNRLYEETIRDLRTIENKVGTSNAGYKEVRDAISMAVSSSINLGLVQPRLMALASDLKSSPDLIIEIKEKIALANRLLSLITYPDSSLHAKQAISFPLEKIKQIESKINPRSGCFIATYVYDDYNSKEVLLLRYFRDIYLSKSILGKAFIKVYYYFSPKMVFLIKDYHWPKKIIKPILKVIAKRIK
jgi:hypothetical protein